MAVAAEASWILLLATWLIVALLTKTVPESALEPDRRQGRERKLAESVALITA